jgi:hypothetical protein
MSQLCFYYLDFFNLLSQSINFHLNIMQKLSHLVVN